MEHQLPQFALSAIITWDIVTLILYPGHRRNSEAVTSMVLYLLVLFGMGNERKVRNLASLMKIGG